jgi:hypothetical protein
MSKFKDLGKLRRALGVDPPLDRTCKDCTDYREVTHKKMWCQNHSKYFDCYLYICNNYEPRDGARF